MVLSIARRSYEMSIYTGACAIHTIFTIVPKSTLYFYVYGNKQEYKQRFSSRLATLSLMHSDSTVSNLAFALAYIDYKTDEATFGELHEYRGFS